MLHPWGGSSGTEQGKRETGGSIRTGVIVAAAIIFHQESKDVSADLMVEGEDMRRYLRTCGFTEAESEEIIADAHADQPSTSMTQDLVIPSFLQHAFQDFLRKWPKQWASCGGDTAEEAARAGKPDAREASAGVGTPARTPARNDEGHVGTPLIPTPKALFTHPRKLEGGHEGAEEETADEAAATLASTTPSARTTASFTAMHELWEQAVLESEERQYQELEREELWAEEERLKEAEDAEAEYYRSSPQWVAICRRSEADRKLIEQARQESGTQEHETTVELIGVGVTHRVIIKKIIASNEVVYIMSNEGHPTQWVSVNPHIGTRDGVEYETTTQSTQDIDALPGHSKPRARPKTWDEGPPLAVTDALGTSLATGQPTADIDAAQTHFTHTHATRTYMQDARKSAEGPVHSPTPTPPTKLIPPPTSLSSLPLLTNHPSCTQPGTTGRTLNKLRKRRGIGRSGRGGMWMTAGVRSSSHRRTSPTGRSLRLLLPRRMRRRSKASGNGRRRKRTRSTRRTNRCSPPKRAGRRGATNV
jgi:hypothetical protein